MSISKIRETSTISTSACYLLLFHREDSVLAGILVVHAQGAGVATVGLTMLYCDVLCGAGEEIWINHGPRWSTSASTSFYDINYKLSQNLEKNTILGSIGGKFGQISNIWNFWAHDVPLKSWVRPCPSAPRRKKLKSNIEHRIENDQHFLIICCHTSQKKFIHE